MKKIIVEHFVNATIMHRKKVIAIFVVLCLLSLLFLLFFLKIDLSFMGIAGKNIDEVKSFNSVIKEFNVSGTTTVILQPVKTRIDRIDKLKNDIIDIIGKNIVNQYTKEIIDIIRSDIDKKRKNILDNDEYLEFSYLILRSISQNVCESVLNELGIFSRKEIRMISDKNADKEKVLRKLDLMTKSDIINIMKLSDDLSNKEKSVLINNLIENIRIDSTVDIIRSIKINNKSVLKNIDDIKNDINIELEKFSDYAHIVADRIKTELISDRTSSLTDETMKDIINGVFYYDDFSFSKDKQMFMIMISSSKNIDELISSMNFAFSVDNVLNELKEEYSEIKIGRTGYAVIQRDQESKLLDNFWLLTLITMFGILIIFFIGLRRLVYPVISMIPLLIGILIMFGISSLILEEINLLSLMTPIILFGLSIDYSIHLGSRYGEVRGELGDKASQAEVLRKTYDSIGMGLFIASLTTIFAFMSFFISSIGGFVTFGIMSTIGILTSFLSMMYLLPIFITWRERKYNNAIFNFLNTKKFPKLGKFSNSKGSAVITGMIVLLSLSSVFTMDRLELETNALLINPEGVESLQLSRELEKKFDYSDMHSYFILDSYDKLGEFRRLLLSRNEDGSLKYVTINHDLVMDARRSVRSLEKIGWDRDIDTLDKYIDEYESTTGFSGASNENIAQLYDFIIRNFANLDKEKYLVTLPPSGYVWNTEFLNRHIKEIEDIENNFNTEGSGLVEVWNFILTNMISDLALSSLIAFGLVILILIIALRSIRGTIICVLSLFLSVIATLSVMAIIGMKFNVVNIVAFPLIIGLGIDYSVHIFYRIVNEEKCDIENAISSTGKAVLFTTLTTLTAFGSFVFSVHPGFADFGILVSIGIALAFMNSLFVIPNLVKIFYRKGVSKCGQ